MVTHPICFGITVLFCLLVLSPMRWDDPKSEIFLRAILAFMAAGAAILAVS